MKNYTALTLLRMGCSIEYPSGYRLSGQPEAGYIQLSTPFGPDGVWILDKKGVNSAIRDAEEYEKKGGE